MIVSRQYAQARMQGFGFFFLIPAIIGAVGSIAGSAIGASSADAQAQAARDAALQQSATNAQLVKMQGEQSASAQAAKMRQIVTIGAIGAGALVTLVVVSSLLKKRPA